MAFGPLDKHPEETLDVPIDWSAKVNQWGTTISASTWTVSTGLTVSSSSIVGKVAIARVSGGTAGATYTLQNKVTFVNGQVRIADVSVVMLTDAVT